MCINICKAIHIIYSTYQWVILLKLYAEGIPKNIHQCPTVSVVRETPPDPQCYESRWCQSPHSKCAECERPSQAVPQWRRQWPAADCNWPSPWNDRPVSVATASYRRLKMNTVRLVELLNIIRKQFHYIHHKTQKQNKIYTFWIHN